MKILTNYDFNKNQIQNAAVHNLAAAPATPVEGQQYFNTGDHILYTWNGTAWVAGGVAHTGDVTGETALTIASKAVTLAKMADMATSSILGRATAATGVPEVLTATQVRTILNVADGANNYSHPTGDGNSHVPATSTTNNGKVLTAGSSANSATWTPIPTHTGDVTGDTALTIAAGAVTLAKMANMASGSLIYRKTTAAGAPEVQTLATLKTDLGLTGTNSGDQNAADVSIADAGGIITATTVEAALQEIKTAVDLNTAKVTNATHTGDVTGSAALTIASKAVTLAKMADMATASFIGRTTAAAGVPEVLSAAQARTILNVADGAQVNVATNLGQGTLTTTTIPLTSSTGSGTTLPSATQSLAGLMSAADKTALDALGSAGATAKTHTQNTDTGTSSTTFTIGTSGPKLKNNSGTMEIRDVTDVGYGDLKVKNLYVTGDTTTVSSNTIELGDSEILLNQDITTSAGNSDGGIAIKRLKADNATLANALLTYNNSTGKWQTTQGAVANTLVTAQIANKVSGAIGDGSATSYVITHNLDSQNLVVSIRETASPYALVYTDIEMTSVNTITVKFAVAPSSNQYTVTIIG